MSKTINTNKSPAKRALKVLLIIFAAPGFLILLALIFYFGSKPILDNIDKDKFTTLDTQMKSVYEKIKTASNGADNWKYSASCISDRSGWMETGVYHCVTSISTQKTITTAQELSDLQTKYYPIIDSSDTLKQLTNLDIQLPNDFGKNFVVSSAEKNYTEKKSNTECTYLIKLDQSKEDDSLSFASNISYGSKINYGIGNALISFRCEGKARYHWYKLSETTDLLIP